MALSRKGKIWLAVLATPVVLVGFAIVAAKLYFTSERLKELVIPRVETIVHRQVAVGSIGFSILPSLAVEIDSLSIANRSGKGFSPEPMLTLGNLRLSVRLAPLFKGNIEITTVQLEHPRLLIEVNAQGVANYAGLGGPADSSAQAQGQTAPAAQRDTGLLLSNLQIHDGELNYIDRSGNSATRIDGLNHTMRLEVASGSGDIRVDGQTSIDRLSYGAIGSPMLSNLRLTLDEQFEYKPSQDLLTIERGVLTVQDMILSMSGSVASATKTPVLALAIESDTLNIAALLSLVPREYMKKAEGLRGNGLARVKLTVNGPASSTATPDIRGSITATNASVQYPQLPKPITDISLRSSFTRTATQQEFVLEKFSASLGNNPLTATMRVENFNDPSLTLAVQASLNLADVKDYYPVEQGTEMRGNLTADVNIAGMISKPAAMKASGSMQFRDVTVKTPTSKKPVENLRGTITFNNQVVEAKNISMTLGRSDLSLAFALRNYLSLVSGDPKAPRATASLSLQSTHLYSADIMTDTSRPAATSGSVQKSPPQAKGKAMVLPDVDMELSASIGTFVMEKFTFSNFRASASVSKGIITLKSCTMNAFEGTVGSRGTLNLQKPEQPTFDFTLNMNGLNAHTMLPNFTSFGERISGRMTMATTLKGALNDTLGLVPEALNGSGHVQLQNGTLTGVKINTVIASLLKLPDLETITFKDWGNDFSVANGRLVIKDLKINALNADYTVNGSQGLDGTLDYSMSMLLAENTSSRISLPGFAGQAVDLFREPGGQIKLDFTVGGTTDDPKVSLDTHAATKKGEDMLKQKAVDEAKKLQDQLKGKGDDLLKGLFKKKK